MNGTAKLMRYTAFSDNENGGNPAGVWIGDKLPQEKEMQTIAKEIGYSETAFITPFKGLEKTVRYYSPEMEVTFCGHATIASGIALGVVQGAGTYTFSTLVGDIPVSVTEYKGLYRASLTSVAPESKNASDELIEEVLNTLNWSKDDIDYYFPPSLAYAGAWHLVLAAKTINRLNRLEYEFNTLKSIMEREGLTTIQLIWCEKENLFHARNPFPVGGVVEDPATGASAAALGGYLREKKLVKVPSQVIILQGEAMGRPGRLEVDIPEEGGIKVSGTAVEIKG